MKTVTIPTCANPFVVIVNGIKYTYPAGATVEVPDDVAEVIEQHEEAKPEPAPVLPPYSGGVKSWNDLEDKPFGEETTLGDTLTWDGTPSDIMIPLSELFSFHRVSDQTPAIDEVFGGTLYIENTVYGGYTVVSLQESNIVVLNENAYAYIDTMAELPAMTVVNEDNVTITALGGSLYVPKKGIYFLIGATAIQTSKLVIPGYNRFPNTVATPLETKFAPEPPYFDLVKAGVSVIENAGKPSRILNLNSLRSALDKGAVKLTYKIKYGNDEETRTSIVTATRVIVGEKIEYNVIIPLYMSDYGPFYIWINVYEDHISTWIHGLEPRTN